MPKWQSQIKDGINGDIHVNFLGAASTYVQKMY